MEEYFQEDYTPLMEEIDRVKRKIPPREIVTMWLRCVANNQFTLQEIEDGTAYRLLNEV